MHSNNAMSQQNLDDFLLAPAYQKTEPFLWIHLALLAAVPLAIVLCMMGLAVGDPVFPGWLEMLVMGLPPVALTVWLQWQNPLYPFSLWVLAKPAAELSEDRRRVLTVLRRRINGWYVGAWVAVVVGVFSYVVFRQIYLSAPLAAEIAPFPPALRLLGILWAEAFFLIANLLLQMGVAAARVLLIPPSEFLSITPYEADRISKDFTIVGKRSPQLLYFATEPLTPIQQKVELITESEPAQLPSTEPPVSNPPDIAGKVKPLLAKLSSLVSKVTDLLPKKSAPTRKPEPVSPITAPEPSPSATSVEPAIVESQVESPAEMQAEAVSEEVWEEEDIAKPTEAVTEVGDEVSAETSEALSEPISSPDEAIATEEIAASDAAISIEEIAAAVQKDADVAAELAQSDAETATESLPVSEDIGAEEATDIASDTAQAPNPASESLPSQSDRPDSPDDDEEWV
jgi:hypothetical protein